MKRSWSDIEQRAAAADFFITDGGTGLCPTPRPTLPDPAETPATGGGRGPHDQAATLRGSAQGNARPAGLHGSVLGQPSYPALAIDLSGPGSGAEQRSYDLTSDLTSASDLTSGEEIDLDLRIMEAAMSSDAAVGKTAVGSTDVGEHDCDGGVCTGGDDGRGGIANDGGVSLTGESGSEERSWDSGVQPAPERAAADTSEALEGGIFTPYSCPKLPFAYGTRHCGEVVETTSLAAVQPPDFTYQALIPNRVIQEGRLSDLQIEAVMYAGQRHRQFNMDGTRGGFMLGDGTGVGKGRTCAGIMYDYFLHECAARKQQPKRIRSSLRPIMCVWVSVSWDLAQDARRDITAITEPLDPDPDEEASAKNAAVLPVVTIKEAQSQSFTMDEYTRTGLVIFATYSVFSRELASPVQPALPSPVANDVVPL
eukprot:COSAG01_NODE_2476_length_7619_cov_35.526596_2_plen_424_part_00